MRTDSNIIEKSTIAFRYPNRNLASHCNNLIERIFATHILPEIDQVFNSGSVKGINLELDSLVIDIGQIKETELERYLGEKIRIALSLRLSRSLAENYGFLKEGEFNQPATSFFGEGLYFYLTRGFKPNWIQAGLDIEKLMDFILTSNPEYFNILIKKIRGNKEANKRWVFGISNEYFDKLILVLQPSDSEWIREFRVSIGPIIIKNAEIPAQSEDFDRSINYFILEFISDEAGSEFNRLSFAESVLRQIASHYNIRFGQFINILMTALDQKEFVRPKYQKLHSILTKINDDEAKHQKGEESNDFDWIHIFNNYSWEQILRKFTIKELRSVIIELSERKFNETEAINEKGIFTMFRLFEDKGFKLFQIILFDLLKQIDLRETKRLQRIFFHWIQSKREEPFESDSNLLLLKAVLKEISNVKVVNNSDLETILKMAQKYNVNTPQLLLENKTFEKSINPVLDKKTAQIKNQYDPVSIKKSILSNYLKKGMISYAFRGISRSELKQIFLESLKLDDEMINEIILKNSDHDQLVESFKTLLDSNNIDFFLKYINQHFGGFTRAFQNSPTEKVNLVTEQIESLDFRYYLLSALVYSKGDQNSPYFNFFHTKAYWEFLIKDFENINTDKGQFTEQLQGFFENRLWSSSIVWKVERKLGDLFWYKRIWNKTILTASSMVIKRILKNKKTKFSLPSDTALVIPPKSRWLFESLRNSNLEASALEKNFKSFFISSKGFHQAFSSKLEIIRFWFDKGYLPWWSNFKSINDVVLSLDKEEFQKDKLKLEALRMLFADIGNLKKLKSQIPVKNQLKVKVKLIQILGEEYVKSDFQDENSLENIEVNVSKPEKSFYKTPLKNWFEKYFQDKNLLEKVVYLHGDDVLLQKFFGKNIKIKEQVEVLLEFTPYIYFGNLTGSKWRRMVYEFAIQFHGPSNSMNPEKFQMGFLLFIQRKYAVFNWSKIFEGFQKEIVKGKLKIKIPHVISKTYRLDKDGIPGKKEPEIITTGQKVKINNSGLVLTWPFLTMFFTKLGLLEGNRFKDEKSRNRAVYLLQYLAFGEVDFPEYDLVLNKLLVGLPPHVHLDPGIVLTDEEKKLSKSLLNGMLQNWEKLKTSTIEALQVTFLRRVGELVFEDNQISLEVESKGVDALLDSISWNIKLVKLTWMDKPIQVKWR